MAQPRVSIVTPVHNRREHTLAYLASLERCTYPNLHVVIVDDGSTDGSAAAIRERFPDVTLLEGDGSLWWSGATNLGVEDAIAAGSEYVVTLNNDVEVDPEFVGALVACACDRGRALVGSKVNYRDEPGRVWFFGAELDRRTGDIRLLGGRDEDFPEAREAPMLTGMGMLVPVEAFRAAGLFDVRSFPQYLADSDFSLRAKARGYGLVVEPRATVYADVGAAWIQGQFERLPSRFAYDLLFSIRSQYDVRVRYRFYRRHWGKGWAGALLRLYGGVVARILVRFYARKAASLLRPRARAPRSARS
jgi:GT2 family glycosyltransferase